jgi:hypothetical protein
MAHKDLLRHSATGRREQAVAVVPEPELDEAEAELQVLATAQQVLALPQVEVQVEEQPSLVRAPLAKALVVLVQVPEQEQDP